jgi:hypothetical protein
MRPPDDPKAMRRLLARSQEAIELTGDADTVRRIEEYASELRRQLERLRGGTKLNKGHP